MKNNTIKMFLAVGAACVFGTALDAQTNNLSAKIPFAFQVNGKAFAPGKYLVGQSGYGHAGVPFFQSSETGESVYVAGADHSLSHASDPKLVFHCYAGKTCFLAEIRPRNDAGSHVPMTKAEKEIVNSDQPREMAIISVDLRHAD